MSLYLNTDNSFPQIFWSYLNATKQERHNYNGQDRKMFELLDELYQEQMQS